MFQTRLSENIPIMNPSPSSPADSEPSLLGPKLSHIANFGRSKFFHAKTAVYSQEDPADFSYLVAAGMVSTPRLTSDGRRSIGDFHLPGAIFGMESGNSYTSSAEAMCDTLVLCFARDRLEDLASTDRLVEHELFNWYLHNSNRTAWLMLLLGRGSAIEKLAYFLLDVAKRVPNSTRLNLPMSRTDIGDYLGLSSETVSRTFTTLRQQGLIAIDGHSVLLLKPKALSILAGS